ncbi:FtsW/RodA/SpoVE family cell cycle protein [Defluviitalea phaphyphila]|uniref:FtsW/RodA/SpoVE family cell cycle protein n=1 Tax=Defluviitalea phaphyphila TaxID=1473580 RepID=UPI00073141F8|nr:FtsW/RodA/SpoVE family cell cycle protein [Defluviitalea phaphyphila]
MSQKSIVEIIILISRNLFLLLIFMFLYSGYKAAMYERKKERDMYKKKIFMQRCYVIILHFLGFIILIINSKNTESMLEIAKIGMGGAFFIIFSIILISIIYKKGDAILWNSVFFLMDIGLIMLQRLDPQSAEKQLIWYSLGVGLTLLFPFIFKIILNFEKFKVFYAILGWIFILSPLLFGKEQFGAKNWILIGNFGFQPSEIVKLLFIFYLSASFIKYKTFKDLIFPIIMSGGYILILVIQRDLGGALIYFLTFLVLLYISTSSVILFFGSLGGASLASMLAYKLFNHVRVRVEVWLNPWKEIDSKGYQITQSLFAIGTWGWLGSGLTLGYPTSIPVVNTDFIFSAICEEFGNLFGIGVILIFLLIVFRGIIISIRCNEKFYSLIGVGISNLIAIQTFLIVGGVIKMIPLTGVTLPFISYGGSSAIVSIIMIGLLQCLKSFYILRKEGEKNFETI